MPNNTLVDLTNRELSQSAVEDVCPQPERICLEKSEHSALYEYDPADDADDEFGIKCKQALTLRTFTLTLKTWDSPF